MKFRFGELETDTVQQLKKMIRAFIENEMTNGPGWQIYDEDDREYPIDVSVEVKLTADCPRCKGEGNVEVTGKDSRIKCPSCLGRRSVEITEEPVWLGMRRAS